MNETVISTAGNSLAEVYDKIRERASTDLYYMARFIFGLSLFDAPFHANLAAFMAAEHLYPRTIVLAPRGGGKSTLAAIRKIQRFINNPDCRQLHVSYDLGTSLNIANQVKDFILNRGSSRGSTHWFRILWPTHYNALRQAEERRTLRQDEWHFPDLKTTSRRDAQFKWSSIDSGITGLHADVLDVDDLIDEVAVRSPAECARARDWVETSTNVLAHQTETPFHIIGTHYHLQDPYAYILERHPEFTPFIHPALLTTYDESGKATLASYWPSRFTVEQLLQMRDSIMGSEKFAALMQQNPIQREDAPFRQEHLRFWEWGEHGRTIVRHDGVTVRLADLTIAMIYDPALGSDKSRAAHAIVVCAMDSDGMIYLLDEWELVRGTVESTINVYAAKAAQWDPDVTACEAVLFQSLILPTLRTKLELAHVAAYRVVPVQPSGRSKDTRILALAHWFDTGRVMVHRSHDNFISQLLAYPFGKRRDLLDAFAYSADVLYLPTRTTVDVGPFEIPREYAAKLEARRRDQVTGY